MNEKPDGGRSVKSAERVLDILEHIGMHPHSPTFGDIGRELGIPKSSLHALLEVLTSRGYLECDAGTRRYSLGTRAWETGQAYRRQHNLIGEAQTVLEGIVGRVNETAQLARLVGTENVYLAKVESSHALRLQSEVGVRLPAHATGVGKALLAQLSDPEIRARFGNGGLATFTRNTLATMDLLADELEAIRRRGFAIDNEEYTPGVFCIAVPVHESAGLAGTAISVSLPTSRAEEATLATILAVLAEGSLQLSARCGVSKSDPLLEQLSRSHNAAGAIEALLGSGRYDLPFPARQSGMEKS